MTKAQRKRISTGMKAAYAKKKAGKGQKKFDFEEPGGNAHNNLESFAPPPVEQAKAMQVQEDMKRFGDFQFRRGLVTAIECILRELR